MKICGLILLSFILISFNKNEDVLVWSKNRSLTWNDFRGRPELKFAAASTHYMLKRYVTEENNKIEAHVLAYFFCKESWKRKKWIDSTVLRHEQKHFDIVELYARKLRKAISTITIEDKINAITKVDSLYKIHDKSMDAFQDEYDEKSNHSMNHDMQLLWEKNINSALDSLNDYENNTILLKMK